MTNRVPRIDTDADDQVENANVDALVNLSASDTLSAYPLAIGTDTDHAASDHADGGALEIDVADLAGGSGTADQVPVTDGAAVTWGTVGSGSLASQAVTAVKVDGSGGSAGQVLDTDGTAGGVAWTLVGTSNLASQAVTATEVDGSGGTAGQVLDTDGTASGVSWTLITTSNIASQAVTPTEVDGSGGTADQVLTTDGTAGGVTWSDQSTASWTTSTITSDTTASDNDELLADSSSAALTVTLPSPSNGLRVRVMRIASANGVTVARNGTENINGNASDLSLSYLESVELVSDGTDWWIV